MMVSPGSGSAWAIAHGVAEGSAAPARALAAAPSAAVETTTESRNPTLVDMMNSCYQTGSGGPGRAARGRMGSRLRAAPSADDLALPVVLRHGWLRDEAPDGHLQVAVARVDRLQLLR